MTIFQCENSTYGIFSGVYDAWDSRLGHENIRLQIYENVNYELFSDYVQVPVDPEKAEKVARTLRLRLHEDDYHHIYHATLSKDREKADNIYRTIVLGLHYGGGRSIMQNLQNRYICRVFELSRNTEHEAHQYTGFVRFRELQNKILFSEIQPENYVLPLMGEHFADRFPKEHFLIYDNTHEVFLVHEAHKAWGLVEGETLNREQVENISKEEEKFRKLWKGFCRNIAVQERTNKRLQQQLLPLRYRRYMTESFE